MSSLISEVIKTAIEIKTGRNEYNVLAHVMEEVGELAEEITISNGFSYKETGPDGVIGEAVDTIITLVDLITVHAARIGITVTEDQLIEIASKKLEKWRRTAF